MTHLRRTRAPKADLFLYGDPMHLSAEGHALVFAELARSLAPN